MKIHVTAEDIAAGARKDCRKCPVALAILRETQAVWVDMDCSDCIQISDESGYLKSYSGDKSADDFIVAFDDGKPVQPFEFELTGKGLCK